MNKILPALVWIIILGSSLAIVADSLDSLISLGETNAARQLWRQRYNQVENAWSSYYQAKLANSTDSAEFYYQKTLQLDPRFERADSAFWLLSQSMYLRGLYRTSEKYLRQFIAFYAQSPLVNHVYLDLARTVLALQEYKHSLALLDTINRLSLTVDETQRLMIEADARCGLGEYSHAFGVIERLYQNKSTQYPADWFVKRLEKIVEKSEDDPALISRLNAIKIQSGHVIEPPDIGPGSREEGSFYCQVGSFGNTTNAQRLFDLLKSGNYPVILQTRQIGARKMTLVWVGPATSLDNARQMGEKLKSHEGLEYIIIRQ